MSASNDRLSPEERDALAQQISDEMTPVAQELAANSRPAMMRIAAQDGWSDPQAEWIWKLSLQTLMQAVVDGTPVEEAMQQAYREGRRLLTIAYFNNARDEGKRPFEAFLVVIDLERQIAERRGATPPDYPDEILKDACEHVEAAGRAGAPAEEQIEIGYRILRERLADASASG